MRTSRKRTSKEPLHFFIDYVNADLRWAEWIVWQLKQAGYTVKYRHRDFQPGSNVVLETSQAVEEAEHVLALLSEDYLQADKVGKTAEGIPVWATALYNDPLGKERKLLPIRVRLCHPKGLLQPIQYIDLVPLNNKSSARKALLDGVGEKRQDEDEDVKIEPQYPGEAQPQQENTPEPGFPATYRPPFWHIPDHNPFFTDREAVLAELYEKLHTGPQGTIHTHVINGLGGVGKTQVALAYAHDYKHCYQAALWIDASNENECIKSMHSLLERLKPELPKTAYRNMQTAKTAIKQWLEQHEHWILIIDNIGDPQLLRDLIPTIGNGHVLFTAQMQATHTWAASMSPLDELQQEDGALFLLRRSKQLEVHASLDRADEQNLAIARELSRLLGNLPLMLDQAGAYIEDTGISITQYLKNYQVDSTWRHHLLHRRGDTQLDLHRESVIETYNHLFLEMKSANTAAYDLLCLCSFLDHEAIPMEIVSQGAAAFLSSLQPFGDGTPAREEAFAILRKYSLLDRHRNRSATREWLSMNPVVQEVLKDGMSQDEQRIWAERAIRAVCRALPEPAPVCLHYIPHVRTCAAHIKAWKITCQEGQQLLYHMGVRLYKYHEQAHIDEQKHIIDALKHYSILLTELNSLQEAAELTGYLDTLHLSGASSA